MTEKPSEPTPTPTGPTPAPTGPAPGPTPPWPGPTPPMPGPTGPDPHLHTWDEAQRMMLNQMTQDQKTAYFQMSPEEQNAAVQDWSQQNFGTNTTTDMPHGGSTVEGSGVGWEGGRPKGS